MMMLIRGNPRSLCLPLWFPSCSMLVHVIYPAQSDGITDDVIDVPLVRDGAEEARHHVGDNARLYFYRPIMKFALVRNIYCFLLDLTQPAQWIDHQHNVDHERRNTHFRRNFGVSVMCNQFVY